MNDAFENWFNSMWLGDGSINETIPTKQSDPRYKDYLAEHCLALGAWKACEENCRLKIEEQKKKYRRSVT